MNGLPKDYLTYPNRKYGQDHDFYDWQLAKDRPKLEWDGGAKVAICFIVPLEFFPLNPSGVPFKHPGAMVTPYPDLRHFTVRDYGNRVGIHRIVEALGDFQGTFAVNGEIAKRYAPLMEHLSNHEIIAHGLSTDNIQSEAMSGKDQQNMINQTSDCFAVKPAGWMSPARNQSSRTLGLLAQSEYQYCLDWEMDQVPVTAKTDNGDITLIPNNYELSDFTLLHTRRQTEESWLKQITDSITLLTEEHDQYGCQMLGLTLTPYVIGQPFRIWALRELLKRISANPNVTIFTAGEIDQQFRAQS
jgi:hypothetical protein